jgi:hypothetical protein
MNVINQSDNLFISLKFIKNHFMFEVWQDIHIFIHVNSQFTENKNNNNEPNYYYAIIISIFHKNYKLKTYKTSSRVDKWSRRKVNFWEKEKVSQKLVRLLCAIYFAISPLSFYSSYNIFLTLCIILIFFGL